MNKKENWGCCEDQSSQGNFITCIKCKKRFHQSCVGCSDSDGDSWQCQLCKGGRRGIRDESAPIKVQGSSVQPLNTTRRNTKRMAVSSPPQAQQIPQAISEEVRSALQEEIPRMVKEISESVAKALSIEIRSVKEDLQGMRESMDFLSSQYEDFKNELTSNVNEIKQLKAENSMLKNTCENLNARVNQLEQSARSNNVEVQCVPENNKENVVSIITKIATVVGCTIAETDILHCSRVAKNNKGGSRPRSIVAQLASPKLRDHLLASVSKFNRVNNKDKLNSSHLGMNIIRQPIFVTEHLSHYNKVLHAATRQFAKDNHFKYVWVRNGKIFMRRSDDSRFIVVRGMDDLKQPEV